MPGQITLDTEFGRALKELGADPRYKVFVEVGAWNGQGSTRCLYEGMRGRGDAPALISFEANKAWWRVAAKEWQDVSGVRVLYGRVAEHMMSEEDIRAHRFFDRVKDHFDLYYEQDKEDFKAAPLIKMRRCDVAVLDGGEFCAAGDWDALKGLGVKVVALDDITVVKNSDLYTKLVVDGWRVAFHTHERNGAAILEWTGAAASESEVKVE